MKKYFALFLVVIFITSCEEPQTSVSIPAPVNPCAAILKDPIYGNGGAACVKYNEDEYATRDYDNFGRQQGNSSTSSKTKNFENLMAPIAVKMKDKYGYPPALLMAQVALETGWGKSSLFRNQIGGKTAMAPAGIRCSPATMKWVKRVLYPGTSKETVIEEYCGKWSLGDKHHKALHKSLEDGVEAYIHLIMTSKYYKATADYIRKYSRQGKVAPLNEELVAGLGSYATGSQYTSKVLSIGRNYEFEKYHALKLCGNETDNTTPMHSCGEQKPTKKPTGNSGETISVEKL